MKHPRLAHREPPEAPVAVTILLPQGYAREGNHRRYPVLYLLHGVASDEWTWVNKSSDSLLPAPTSLIAFTARRSVIVVMPDGGPLGFYTDWQNGTQRWETLHIRKLIPYIDREFRTMPGRAYRAIAGFSMGGYGALSYAARHPDLFVTAASFSGILDLGIAGNGNGLMGLADIGCYGAPQNETFGPWGSEGWRAHDHNPSDLLPNFRRLPVAVFTGAGNPCADESPSDLNQLPPEQLLFAASVDFHARMMAAGVPHEFILMECGTHHHRTIGIRELERWWPTMVRLFGTGAPRSFDYRTARTAFSVWGWSFRADPARVPEFLEVDNASSSGLSLVGSGISRVTTAALFPPRQTVIVETDGKSRGVHADEQGHLRFTVDLGAPHRVPLPIELSDSLASGGGYFARSSVRFHRVKGHEPHSAA